ncbi:MAG: response regulator [Desulfuromonadaceae bacterium]|nr:response regulator [Desulfuromonadaceae bacterium]MDD2855183.1 response regulator [Desulfuromonadaceae bacterium]
MPKILIVDDDPNIRLLLKQSLEELEDQGVIFISADNGEVALDIIRDENPDVVFLDVMMPRMNGFDVCNTVKNKLEIRDVFIILLTVKGQKLDKQKGKDAGADIYMTKPFNPDEILRVARNILGL